MSKIEIRKIDITKLSTDAIVNAANSRLRAGAGVCGAIFAAAGHDLLQAACNEIGNCGEGTAVITPGFNLKAKYIIHTVGPTWSDGDHGEPEVLYSAYQDSLELALENGCHSIGFPLISAGIFGYPVDQAWEKALQACKDFLQDHPNDEMDIIFAVLSDHILAIGEKTMQELASRKPVAWETPFETLLVQGIPRKALFFHLPDEPNGYLSNWYPAAFNLDGLHFTSSEQYIMYRKCLILGDDTAAQKVLATNDPSRQQAIGRKAEPYNWRLWEGMRQPVAMRCLLAKFEQNPSLKAQLLATEDAYLVECAYKDKTWACGCGWDHVPRKDMSQWTGQNILGFTLMEVRDTLR